MRRCINSFQGDENELSFRALGLCKLSELHGIQD